MKHGAVVSSPTLAQGWSMLVHWVDLRIHGYNTMAWRGKGMIDWLNECPCMVAQGWNALCETRPWTQCHGSKGLDSGGCCYTLVGWLCGMGKLQRAFMRWRMTWSKASRDISTSQWHWLIAIWSGAPMWCLLVRHSVGLDTCRLDPEARKPNAWHSLNS